MASYMRPHLFIDSSTFLKNRLLPKRRLGLLQKRGVLPKWGF